MKCAVAWLAVQVFLWPTAPALAVWDNAQDQPYATEPDKIGDYCSWTRIVAGGLGIVGSYSAVTRLNICTQACITVDQSYFKEESKSKIWESACCGLTGAPAASYFIPATLPVAAALKVAMQFNDKVDSLKAKCNEAKSHTGSGACIWHTDRPDGVPDCCGEKSERTTSFGAKCAVQKFTGSDTCKADGVFSCCVCQNNNGRKVVAAGGDLKNCKSCKALCKDPKSNGLGEVGTVSWGEVAFSEPSCGETSKSFEGNTNNTQAYLTKTRERGEDVNMFCWTEQECSKENGKWRKDGSCKPKGTTEQGKCEAPEPDYELQNPVIGATTIKGLRSYIGLIFTAGISFALIAAAIMFVYGAFKYMVSAVGAQIGRAKETMIDALIGMVLALSSYVILANVAPNTLNMNAFKIDMVNRMSFYSVVYCSDIKPGPNEAAITFQDAGSPISPNTFDITQGYTIPLDKTVCGNEYFISGGNQDSICMGKGCPKNAKCLNCASGMSSGCKSSSAHEYSCTDAVVGGNIASVGSIKPKAVYLKMLTSDAAEKNFEDIELDEFSFSDDQIKSTAGGFQTSYRFTSSKISTDRIVKMWDEQEKQGKKVIGIYLIAAFKPSGSIANIFGVDVYNIYIPAQGKAVYVNQYAGGPKNCIVSTAVSVFVNVADTSCTFSGYVEYLAKSYPMTYSSLKVLGMKKQDFRVQDALGGETLLCDIKVGENGAPID